PADALLLSVIRSPHHRARFRFGDLDAFVSAYPGIERVLTAADVPGINCFGVIPPFADQPVFAEGETRFRGEAVAAIVGEANAVEALDPRDFPVHWEELPAHMDMDSALAEDAALVHASRPGNILTGGRVERGDVPAGLAAAAAVV